MIEDWGVLLLGGLFAVAVLTVGGLALLWARHFAHGRGWLTVHELRAEEPKREMGVV